MNGLWQPLGNHHWAIEPHAARPALRMRAGPVDSLPTEEMVPIGTLVSLPWRPPP